MRHLLLIVTFLLSACAAPSAHGPGFRQAAARPAPYQPPPAYTPGYAPGTPAEPVYTPQGTGAYRGDPLPSAPVPRSPNKRVLPATKEAGIWAADSNPGPGEGPIRLFAVDLHVAIPGGPTKTVLTSCALEMTLALRDVVQLAVHNYPEGPRACMAVKALQYCVRAVQVENDKRVRASLPRNWPPAEVHRKAEMQLDMLAAKWCTAELTEEQADTLRSITEKWEWTTKRQ